MLLWKCPSRPTHAPSDTTRSPNASSIPSDRVIPVLSFIRWYTQHPSRPAPPPLHRTGHVSVIGQGNIALDVARMLLTPPAILKKYDVSASVLRTDLPLLAPFQRRAGRRRVRAARARCCIRFSCFSPSRVRRRTPRPSLSSPCSVRVGTSWRHRLSCKGYATSAINMVYFPS
jgi:hypothetical protein